MNSLAYNAMAEADNAAAANTVFVNALTTGRGPNTFRWDYAFGGSGQADGWRLAVQSYARAAEIEALKTDRDACSFCGTRADHGCKHRN